MVLLIFYEDLKKERALNRVILIYPRRNPFTDFQNLEEFYITNKDFLKYRTFTHLYRKYMSLTSQYRNHDLSKCKNPLAL